MYASASTYFKFWVTCIVTFAASQVLFPIPELCYWLTSKSKQRVMYEVAQVLDPKTVT